MAVDAGVTKIDSLVMEHFTGECLNAYDSHKTAKEEFSQALARFNLIGHFERLAFDDISDDLIRRLFVADMDDDAKNQSRTIEHFAKATVAWEDLLRCQQKVSDCEKKIDKALHQLGLEGRRQGRG